MPIETLGLSPNFARNARSQVKADRIARWTDEETNEHKEPLRLLKATVLEGRVITGDAMFCQREVCEQIIKDGGHYFFVVKDNQPTLLQNIQSAFAETKAFSPWMQQQFKAERQATESLEKSRGRIERRRLISTTAVNEYLQWPGTAQVCQITRTVTRGTETAIEVHYAVTSVPRSRADATKLSTWWRGHWGIENRLHWVRDVTLDEDRSRIRTGTSPQIFIAFRNAAVSFLRSLGATNIAGAIRENAYRVDQLLPKLGIV